MLWSFILGGDVIVKYACEVALHLLHLLGEQRQERRIIPVAKWSYEWSHSSPSPSEQTIVGYDASCRYGESDKRCEKRRTTYAGLLLLLPIRG